MKKIDAIIILGGGTDGTLHPVLYTKERLFAFKKSEWFSRNIPIVVSGGYGMWFRKKPKHTEADAMKNFLIKNGVPQKLIRTEGQSRDTAGNAYYSKQIIKKFPSWKSILLITTAGHAPRSLWIFKKIFGRKYNFSVFGVKTRFFSYKNNPGRKRYEKYLIGLYKKIMHGCGAGNDKKILAALKNRHPAFSSSKIARGIRKDIIVAKQKYLGYTSLTASTLNIKR